jgi:hypothetical protein
MIYHVLLLRLASAVSEEKVRAHSRCFGIAAVALRSAENEHDLWPCSWTQRICRSQVQVLFDEAQKLTAVRACITCRR